MANSRLNVAAPSKTKLPYGLLDVADIRPEPTDGSGRVNRHWKAGITWQNVCPDANSTYDLCVATNSFGVTGLPTPDVKAATAVRSSWGATPFTVLVEIDCSPPGFWDSVDEIVSKTFTEAEAFEVESVFWTGSVGGVTGVAFPHIVADSGTTDLEGITLQLAAAPVVTGGALDPVEALGKLEAALATCVKGIGVIHLPAELLASLAENHLLTERNGVYYSPGGHKIVVSAAYTGASPSGVITAGTLWMYGTGPVFAYRSTGTFVGDRVQSLDRSVNTEKRLFERTYVIGYDCCLFGVPVSTGGVSSGTALSAA